MSIDQFVEGEQHIILVFKCDGTKFGGKQSDPTTDDTKQNDSPAPYCCHQMKVFFVFSDNCRLMHGLGKSTKRIFRLISSAFRRVNCGPSSMSHITGSVI